MEILRKNQNEMLEIKNTNRMKNAFDGFISRLDIAEERISEFDVNRNFKNWEAKKAKLEKTEQFWTITKIVKYVYWEYQKEKIERNKRDIWNNNDWEFPWVNVREQTTDPGSSEGTMQDKCPPPTNYTYTYHFQTKEYQR